LLFHHGEMAGEHGMWWKSNFYESSARVPLIASWPGRWAQGRLVDRLVNLVDLGPTLLELAGAKPLAFSRGRSLRRFLPDGRVDPGDWVHETFCEDAGNFGQGPSRMIRSGPWKLCHYHGYRPPQLFNVAEDPDEGRDLAADPAHESVRDDLRRRVLDGWDGEAIRQQLARRREDYDVIRRWNRQVVPPTPDHWKPPANVDTFVDPSGELLSS
jgi:choline-sulfatase